MTYSFDRMFMEPEPGDKAAVERERAAGLDELDLITRGLMDVTGVDPDRRAAPSDENPGTVEPSSGTDRGEA